MPTVFSLFAQFQDCFTSPCLQLAAQLTFLAILPYLNPDGLISRGAHVGGNGNYESDWNAPTGEYMLGPNEYVVEQGSANSIGVFLPENGPKICLKTGPNCHLKRIHASKVSKYIL